MLKLDELLAHLRSVREMAGRLTTLKDTVPGAAAALPSPPATTSTGTHTVTMGPAAAAPAAATAPRGAASTTTAKAAPGGLGRAVDELAPTLHSMAERLAQDHAKRFRLSINGLSDVPAAYNATIKDCLIQMLRNAAVHGIEPPEVRRAQAKKDIGSVQIDFRKAAEGYELLFEDDGAGIAPETLKAAAVRRQLLSAEDAELMDTRAAMALIFRPGFSTQDDISMDAGRGVGMDVVARSVYSLGGKIGVSTHPGKYTRFKILLPGTEPVSTAVA